jgi:hypothetical protein
MIEVKAAVRVSEEAVRKGYAQSTHSQRIVEMETIWTVEGPLGANFER